MEVKSPLRIALIAGGVSAEREVSLKGARQIRAALKRLGYEVQEFDPQTDLARLVKEAYRLDCALLVLHGPFGEDGRMQGFLDMIGLPYQGSGVLGSAIAMDKHLAKTIYTANGIPTPGWRLLTRPVEEGDLQAIIESLGLPLMVKPKTQGSSIGMGIAWDVDGLKALVESAFEWDDELIVEEFIQGRELSVGVLEDFGDWTLPPIEIIPGDQYEFFDYEAKYSPGATQEVCPAPVDPDIEARARDLAKRAHSALGLSDYSRTDMLLTEDGSLLVIETNTIPGMTETSLLPQEAAVAGLGFDSLIDHLVKLAMKKRRAF